MRGFVDVMADRGLPVDRGRPVQVVAAVVGMVLWLLFGITDLFGTSATVTTGREALYLGVYLACLVALAAEMRRATGAMRRSWGAALGAMVVAILATAYYESVVAPMATRPYPSLSDYGRLVIDALIFYAIVLQIRQRVRVWRSSAWLDGAIMAATVFAVGLQFWLAPLLHANAGNTRATITSTFYVVGDLVLLGVVLAGYAMLAWSSDRQWMMFCASLVVLTLGDAVLFTEQALNPHTGHRILLDLGMMGASNALTWSVGLPDAQRSRRPRTGSRYALLVAPGICTLVALILTTPMGHWDPTHAAQAAAGVVLLCVAVRAALIYREVHTLAQERAEVRTDELTGLLNRRGFAEAVQAHLSPRHADGSPLTARLLLLDISRFKEINDSLGHQSGDALLVQFAQRIRDLTPSGYTLARLGGNEFAVFAVDSCDPLMDTGEDFNYDNIAALTDLPYRVDGIALHLAIGASIARYPQHGEDFAALIRAADLAMTHSKEDHEIVEFDPSMAEGFEQSRVIATSELRHALEHDEIVVYYQPKVRLSDELPYGVEALVRWQHPTDGLIFPDTFLPLVERAGLMPRLTDVVMKRAITDVAGWHQAGLPMSVAVNLPAAAVMDASLPGRVKELLTRAELPSNALTVEITEQALLGDRVRCREVLAELRQYGVAVSIDDYGTGYSSLAYLRELPIDELKLDKSFIFPMSSDPRAAAIVRSTIDLAHSLGLDIVAEGVEDDETARQLAGYSCDTAQGYYFSRPVPAPVLLEWFHNRTVEQVPLPR